MYFSITRKLVLKNLSTLKIDPINYLLSHYYNYLLLRAFFFNYFTHHCSIRATLLQYLCNLQYLLCYVTYWNHLWFHIAMGNIPCILRRSTLPPELFKPKILKNKFSLYLSKYRNMLFLKCNKFTEDCLILSTLLYYLNY